MHRIAAKVGRRQAIVGAGLLATIMLAGCASSPPTNPGNLCEVFSEKKNWYRDARRASNRWNSPIPVMMAITHQESTFRARAKPPRRKLLGFIPWRRPRRLRLCPGYRRRLARLCEGNRARWRRPRRFHGRHRLRRLVQPPEPQAQRHLQHRRLSPLSGLSRRPWRLRPGQLPGQGASAGRRPQGRRSGKKIRTATTGLRTPAQAGPALVVSILARLSRQASRRIRVFLVSYRLPSCWRRLFRVGTTPATASLVFCPCAHGLPSA